MIKYDETNFDQFKNLKIGAVVIYKPRWKKYRASDIGHIVGFDVCADGELLVKILWAGDKEPMSSPVDELLILS